MDTAHFPPMHHPHPTMPSRRRTDDDDELEDQMAYLPGSGPSLDPPADFAYEHPEAFAGPTPPGFVTAFWNPYEVKHRRRTSRAQLAVLEHEFETDPKPNADKRRSLAAQLNMTPRAIQVWFQNRRAKIKAIKNKIPGGRGMPKLKPGEKAASRSTRSACKSRADPDSDEDEDEKPDNGHWIQLEASPSTSPAAQSPCVATFPSHSEPAMVASPESDDRTPPASHFHSKPQFTIEVPPPDSHSGPNSARSGPSSPAFPPPQSDFLAPPSPAAMLRRGSAPAPLQGIHRARYSAFTARSSEELGFPPASPISPPDHEVAPVRRASVVGLGRRPSLPDSHLRLPSHPYYSHSYDRSNPGSAPKMQRRGGLLSPVPDVGQEQEQGSYRYSETLPIPSIFPPAPTLHSSQNQAPPPRLYRALPPGMGAMPAAHDLPTQFPARPGGFGTQSWAGSMQQQHVPIRPFVDPGAGPLPAADFSFGEPELGHGEAFNRAMEREDGGMGVGYNQNNGEYNEFASRGEFTTSPNAEFNPPSEFASPAEYTNTLWDARTRFGSMASIASDVTGVSVSSTQATSVSGGLGTAGFGAGNGECAPGDGTFGNGYSLGFPAGFQPDVRRASCPGEFLHQFSGMGVNNEAGNGPRSTSISLMRPSPLGRSLTIAPDAPSRQGLTINPERNLALEAKSLRSPTFPPGQVDPTYPPPPPGPSVTQTFGSREQSEQPQYQSEQSQYQSEQPQYQSAQHSNQASLSPGERALVGGGFGSDFSMGYDTGMSSPSGFDRSPTVEGMKSMENLNGGHRSSGQASPMLFVGVGVEGDPTYDLNAMNPDSLAMAMIGQEYGNEYAFP